MSIAKYLFPVAPAGVTCHFCIFSQHRLKRRDGGIANNVFRQDIVNFCHAENRVVKVEAVPTYLCELSPVPS